MERGEVRVMCNLATEPVKLDNPARLPLLLASRAGIEAAGDKVLLPANTLAILSSETTRQSV
jgi:hypothetical protein